MCPNCGRVGTVSAKTKGYLGKDMNPAKCHECPWVGKAYQCEVKHVAITVGEIEAIVEFLATVVDGDRGRYEDEDPVLVTAYDRLVEKLT